MNAADRIKPGLARRVLLGLALGLASLGSGNAFALAQVDFASSNGSFLVQGLVIDFGDDLEITAARDNADVPDPLPLGFSVGLDDVVLTGLFSQFGSVYFFEIDDTLTYSLSIRDHADQLVLTANFDPGQFLAVGGSGVLAPMVSPEVSNVQLSSPGAYPSLDDLAFGLDLDLSVALSAAAQDVGALVAAQAPVQGSVAGTIAVTALPEPGAFLLMAVGGLAALRLQPARKLMTS